MLIVRGEPGPERDKLKAREYKVDIDSRLGKSVVITKNTPQVTCVWHKSPQVISHLTSRLRLVDITAMCVTVLSRTPSTSCKRIILTINYNS